MKKDLENLSKELKELVSIYDSSTFLGSISLMMQFIASPNPSRSLSGLTSPQRQLYYVAALNLTSNIEKGKKTQYTNDEWNKIKTLLREIEAGYNEFFYPQQENEIDQDWIAKRRVAMPSFLSYFNQGHLNYEEQIIERIIDYFTAFDANIKAKFGISVQDFLAVYDYIDSLPNTFLEEKINRTEGQETWEEFTDRMLQQDIMPPDWLEHLPQHFKNYIDFMQDGGKMYRLSYKKLEEKFGKDISMSFLSALTFSRSEASFLYYTELNPLSVKPLFKLNEDEYQILETKQLVHSIFNLFFQFCQNEETIKDKFFKTRGIKLEDKIEKVFQQYFDNKAIVYKGYYTPVGHEQDLLFLINGTAIIVEAKSSKRKEPMRNPDKAYDLILQNFDEVIQKGYDQAYRVKSYFINKSILKIYDDEKLTNCIAEINCKKYYNVFSVIVTLETFSQLQTDLGELLEIYEDDIFPWSVCIDDLEVFLLALKKRKLTTAKFVHFLNIREKLHGHLICGDELEICGGYIAGGINKKVADSDEVVATSPDLSGIFDKHYHRGGLGFSKEKNMKYKLDDKYFLIGSDKIN